MGGLGGFVTFAYGAVGRRGRHPIEGAIRPPPPLGEGLTCSRGRGSGGAGGRAAVAAAGSGGLWRAWSRRTAAGRAVAWRWGTHVDPHETHDESASHF